MTYNEQIEKPRDMYFFDKNIYKYKEYIHRNYLTGNPLSLTQKFKI